MARFIFTYGSEGQPFCGGWTEIEAPNEDMAIGAFRLVHPCKHGDFLNCSSIYTVEEFLKTKMAKYGNLGHYGLEKITLEVHTGYFGEVQP